MTDDAPPFGRRTGHLALRRAVVPIVDGADTPNAVRLARSLARDVLLLGLVRASADGQLSAAAPRARSVRQTLHRVVAAAGGGVRARARVRVSAHPWTELRAALQTERPDLLVLEWPIHFESLAAEVDDVLTTVPCDLAIVRGPLPGEFRRVLVAVRGGPFADLAVRIGLRLRPTHPTVLHMTAPGADQPDAPFAGLDRVLRRLPEVELRTQVTSDPARSILEIAGDYDGVVLGTSARPLDRRPTLGAVAARLLRDCPTAVVAVRTRRDLPASSSDAASGLHAISILVDKWFAENTYQADEFADLDLLLDLKRRQNVTISLALPALNEQETVGRIVRTIRQALQVRRPLLDEIVLIDSDSTDRTRDIARRLGVPVYIHQQILPHLGPRAGKGEALWKSLLVTRGDIVAWIDTDIVNIHPRFVYGVLGPLLLDRRVQFVKGFYRRPLRVGERTQAGGGGRVTELTARPLLNLFYPELSGIIQPLSGEYAGRRAALERLPFFSGYAVETGLLIDVLETFGLRAIAQVDLLERIHHNQPLEALGKMSFAIIQAIAARLERRTGRAILDEINKSMKIVRYDDGEYSLEIDEVIERERPPMIEVPEYRARFVRPGPP